MQAVCSTSATAFKGISLARKPARTSAAAAKPIIRAAVTCKVDVAKKVAAVTAALPAALATHPALALVDSRLNGDGVGLPLGINASGPGIALLIVFSLIWALFYNSQKDLDGGIDSDDSGLSL